ncbi:MAG: 1-acyl-sn-glycerol-3-phosphate acyltransferase [Clostridia bacterium]|nr:1-acyl-sn-glycerol-3-phosphate acyltransferase [Clostridia bacterium]
MEKSSYRQKILNKIPEFEQKKLFDVDLEDDPPSKELMPDEVDYLGKKLSSKIKTKFAYFSAKRFMLKMIKKHKLIISKINGLENLKNLKTGAVLTCNHFNPLDSFAMEYLFRECKFKNKKLYRVIREGNYTNFPGFYGMIMRNCHTLPLSRNSETMKNFLRAVDYHLKNNNLVLVYPEQALWWNYKKPRPLQDGAFKFATKSDVPVVPIFITMEDTVYLDDEGYPVQAYTINVFPPIYQNKQKSKAENVFDMKKKNFQLWVNCYEKTYNTKYDLKID